jgi:hypothetical protein
VTPKIPSFDSQQPFLEKLSCQSLVYDKVPSVFGQVSNCDVNSPTVPPEFSGISVPVLEYCRFPYRQVKL